MYRYGSTGAPGTLGGLRRCAGVGRPGSQGLWGVFVGVQVWADPDPRDCGGLRRCVGVARCDVLCSEPPDTTGCPRVREAQSYRHGSNV